MREQADYREICTKLLAALTVLAILSPNGQSQNGLRLKFGTWKLNLHKSRFASGTEPQSYTRVYEDRGGGVVMSTHTTVNQQGQVAITLHAAKFDGKTLTMTLNTTNAEGKTSQGVSIYEKQ